MTVKTQVVKNECFNNRTDASKQSTIDFPPALHFSSLKQRTQLFYTKTMKMEKQLISMRCGSNIAANDNTIPLLFNFGQCSSTDREADGVSVLYENNTPIL